MVFVFRLTERANQTIVTHLMKVVNEKADDWDRHLSSVFFGYRVNRQGSTKLTLFELLYSVRPRLPFDVGGDITLDDEEDGNNSNELVNQRGVDLGQRLVELRQKAHDNIDVAQAKQKARYDIKHQGSEYVVGK